MRPGRRDRHRPQGCWRRWLWPLLLAVAANAPAQDWMMEQYNSDNGLPQNSVVGIVMDRGGYAWLSTEGGLVRFDGTHPYRISLPMPGGAPQRVRDIIGVRDGSFAVRDSHSRKFVLRDGHVSTFGSVDIDIDPYPFCRGTVPTLAAYLFTTNHRWQGSRSFKWTDDLVTLITVSDREWLATSTLGLLHLRDTTVIGVVPPTSSEDRFFSIGGLVFGFNAGNTPFRVDLERHTTHPIVLAGTAALPGQRPAEFYNPAWRSNDDHPCVRVGDELFTLRRSVGGDTLFADPLHVVLPSTLDITAVLVDEQRDVVLVGTATQGLFVYRRAPMRTLRCDVSGPGENNIYYAQVAISDERIAVMGGPRAHAFTKDGCDPLPLPVDSFNHQGVLRGHAGQIWYAEDTLICRYDPVTNSRVRIHTGQGKDARVLCFWEEGDSVWVGLDQGHGFGYVRNDGFIHTCSSDANKRSLAPVVIRRGPDGALWFGSCAGAYRLDGGGTHFTVVPGAEGLCVRNLQRIGERLYLGTYGMGPWVFEHGTLKRLPTDPLGYLDHVHSFMPDSLGFLWLSTNHGLFRVYQHDIDAYLRGEIAEIYYGYYGKPAGILNTEFNGGCDPTYVRLNNGFASFPTLDGLVWFKPERIPDPFPSAPVRLDEVIADGRSLPDSGGIELRPEQNELIVRFSLAYWGDPANVQLMYKLTGVQDEWYPLAADQRELRLQHLPHGEHTLTIRKSGASMDRNGGDTVLHFTVRKPYYMAGWFILLCATGVALVYAAVLRVYQLRLRRQNIALARMVRSRTLELQSINQRLERSVAVKERLVSIISHDIVTPLHFIARVAHRVQRVSDETPAQEISGTLHDIALSSDKLYMNARNLLNWIKHQGGHIELRCMNVAMAALVDDTLGPVRELAATKGTELLNLVPLDDIVRTDRDVVGIILQNLVNNALNHGEGGRVVVSGEQRPEAYRLIVADDGPGLPERTANAIRLLQESSGRSRPAGSDVLGLGYVIITELLQLLGGELLIADNAGRGSRITVVLPPAPDTTGHGSNGIAR